MFQHIPTDNIRQILLYLSVAETWSLFQAFHKPRPVLYRAVRSLCFSQQDPNQKMWAPLRCQNRRFSNPFYCPRQHVPVRVHIRIGMRNEPQIHLSAKCGCCGKRTSWKLQDVSYLRKLFVDHRALEDDPWSDNHPLTPYYLSPHVCLAGYYKPLPDHFWRVRQKLDVLDENSVWYPAMILNTTDTHVHVRYLGRNTEALIHKTSPRLAKFGLRVRNWSLETGTRVDFQLFPNGRWRNGIIVRRGDTHYRFLIRDREGYENMVSYNRRNIVWDGMMTKPMGKNGYCARHHVSYTRWHKKGEPVFMSTEGGALTIIDEPS